MDQVMQTLNKAYGNKVIDYQVVGFKDNSATFSSIKTWTKPMWIFHLLRFIAIHLDRCANQVRKLIYKYTKENVELNFKDKNEPKKN